MDFSLSSVKEFNASKCVIDSVRDQSLTLSRSGLTSWNIKYHKKWPMMLIIVLSSLKTVNSKSDEPMTLYFTSGTTGAPKMAEHTHGSLGFGHFITAR